MLRHAGNAAALAVGALLVACGQAAEGPAPAPGRHVIVISIDTLRADHLGAWGYARPTSPRIDALAAESVLFERAYANSNSTAPSHMTLMTGVLPPVHGVRHREARAPSAGLATLAELFARAGYATAGFADGGFVTEAFGFARGFQHFDSRLQRFDSKLDDVERWLEQAADQPTFLFIHTYGVHAPYLPLAEHDRFTDPAYDGPLAERVEQLAARREGWTHAADLEELMEAFWKQRGQFDARDVEQLIGLYDGCIHEVDAGLGRLLELLQRRGWLDEAWLVVVADHGEAFREHGTFEHRQLHQAELHVPLLIRPPGGAAPARVTDVVSLVDVAPTLLALVGLEPPATMQGRPLLPLERPGARPVHATSSDDERLRAVLEGAAKLIVQPGGERELYDLAADPGERRNLAAEPDAARAADELQRLYEQIEADCAEVRDLVGEPGAAAPLDAQQEQDLRALGYLR